ncbi:MAG: serine hydrolase domain-containing protein [Tessaracoccus sp.]
MPSDTREPHPQLSRENRRPLVLAGAVALIVGLLAAIFIGPQFQGLGQQSSGDPGLAERVRDVVGEKGGYRSLVVAEVTPDTITWAGLGNAETGRSGSAPGPSSGYEVGSIVKTFTGALFADAIERGEVSAEDTLDGYIEELSGTAAGGVTLGSLAQHSSGLPPLGGTAHSRGTWAPFLNEDPYVTTTREQLVEDAREAPVNPEQPPTYSNFGWSLLGEALVRAADASDYPTLLAERITGPVGMPSDIVFAASQDDIPSSAVVGFTSNGLSVTRWSGEGYLPSGTSTFAPIEDIALWAQANLTGEAPGAAALEPTADFAGPSRIGWAWLTSPIVTPDGASHEMVWHNGGTAGFRTMLAIDPAQERAIVVMGNTTTDTDPIAMALLYGTEVPGPPTINLIVGWVIYGVGALFALLALRRSLRGVALLPMLSSLAAAVLGLVLVAGSGPWESVGGWAYGLLLGTTLAAAAIMAMRSRRVPWRPEKRAWMSWFSIVVSVLLSVGLLMI